MTRTFLEDKNTVASTEQNTAAMTDLGRGRVGHVSLQKQNVKCQKRTLE